MTDIGKLNTWWHNRLVNPFTKRRIKKDKKVYNKLLSECLTRNAIKDDYKDYHNDMTDPIIKIPLPLEDNKPVYEYPYCWDCLSGEIVGIDPRGKLYFDPCSLVHYFYVNRYKYLYIEPNGEHTGCYGEAVGIGDEFYFPNRGNLSHYYLFRLPLIDAYLDKHSLQQATLTPRLSLEEITKIYNLAKEYNNTYQSLYKRQLPNLIEIWDLYHEAIKKTEYDISDANHNWMTKQDYEQACYVQNTIAVNKLINM